MAMTFSALKAPQSGNWYPSSAPGTPVEANGSVGYVHFFSSDQFVLSDVAGTVAWIGLPGLVSQDETVCVVRATTAAAPASAPAVVAEGDSVDTDNLG